MLYKPRFPQLTCSNQLDKGHSLCCSQDTRQLDTLLQQYTVLLSNPDVGWSFLSFRLPFNNQSKSGYGIANLKGNQTKDKSQVLSSTHARSNLEAFQLWPLWPVCSQNQARSYMLDLTLGLFFQRRPGPYCAKLSQIQSVWPGQVLARTQLAHYQFPTFRLSCIFPQTSQIILCKTQPGSNSVMADCVRFWQSRSGPVASQCARIIWPTSGPCFQICHV